MQQQKRTKKNRISLYCLLLLCVLVAGSVLGSVGVTQARYGDTVSSPAVLKASAMDISSNCLVSADDAARTVLLGEIDLEISMTVPFWLLSSGESRKVKLNWGVTDPEHKEYLSIGLMVGSDMLTAGEAMELPEDIRLDLQLYMAPTEIARTTAHGKTKINVYVTLDDTMWGTFQVILPEVGATEAEIAEVAAEISETPEPEEEPATEPNVTPEPEVEPAAELTIELSETPEATEEPTPTPTPTVEPTAGPTMAPTEDPTAEPTPEPTVAPTAEPTAEPTPTPTVEPTAEPTPTPTMEPTPEPTVEPTTTPEPTANPYEEQEALMELEAMAAFDPTRQLPVVMTLADHITSVRFGTVEVSEEDTDKEEAGTEEIITEAIITEIKTLEALPDYTMFSVDNGNSYYMVYGDFVPELVVHDITTIPLLILMDFRYTKLTQDEELTIGMEAYMGNELRKTCTAVTAATESVTAENQMGAILNFENTLEFTLPQKWKEATLKYSVEYMTMTENQGLEYIPVNLSQDGLQVTYINDESNHRLELELGQKFNRPGTYRITISWSYNGLCYDTTQTTFFVNCQGREEAITNGSEVQNDE